MKALIKSFSCAARGARLASVKERNLRIHLLATIVVLSLGWLGQVETWAFIGLMLCCALVMCAECLNTAIESLCDRLAPERHPAIRDVKDIAAGGVLICAVFSAAIACVVFLRPEVLSNLAQHAVELIVLAMLTFAAICVVVRR